MNKKITKIFASSLMLINLMPTTQVLANNCNNNDSYINYTCEHKDNSDNEMDIKIVKQNINHLSEKEQAEFNNIYQYYEKNKTLNDTEKNKLIQYKQTILKSKLGDDYEEFISLIKKDRSKLTTEDKEKLRDFFNKLKWFVKNF